MSKAAAIAAELARRLGLIRIANGYRTDAGQYVFRGGHVPDESLLPCLVLAEGEDAPTEQRGTDAQVLTHYIVEAHGACDPDHPNDAAHDLIADIKRALFTPGGDPDESLRLPRASDGGRNLLCADLAYVGREIVPRADGMARVLAAVTVATRHAENLADP